MKNLFFTLFFALVTATSFAKTESKREIKKYSAVVTTSCGATGVILFDTVQSAIELAMDMEEWLCG